MRKILLTTALVLSATFANDAQSAGLYLGAGYGRIKPKLSFTTSSADSSEYGLTNSVAGWPSRSDDSPDMGNSYGYQADDWVAGLPETNTYKNKKGSEISLAVGWKIPRNPFSFELEYKMMGYDTTGYNLSISDPNGTMYGIVETDCMQNAQFETDTNGNTIITCADADKDTSGKMHYYVDTEGKLMKPINTTQYDFDIVYSKKMETKINALMLNVYFEIPGLGPIDPYIGAGIGKAKTEYTFYNLQGQEYKGGSDGFVNARQIMAGLDYRISGTPWIIGAEYRKFKSNFDEKDEKIPYKSDNTSVMVKVKYDFVSDKY